MKGLRIYEIVGIEIRLFKLRHKNLRMRRRYSCNAVLPLFDGPRVQKSSGPVLVIRGTIEYPWLSLDVALIRLPDIQIASQNFLEMRDVGPELGLKSAAE